MPAAQATSFLITAPVNDMPEDTVVDALEPSLPRHPYERYAKWQLECGEEHGNMHVQAFMQTTRKTTITSVARAFVDAGWPHPHVEFARNDVNADNYCGKEESRVAGPWQRGARSEGRGHRTDIDEAVATLVNANGSMAAVAREHATTFVRNHRGLAAYKALLCPPRPPSDADFVARPWQQRVLDIVVSEPDDRKIVWVTDAQGNTGKSRLARHIVAQHGGLLLEGRIVDMAYVIAAHADSHEGAWPRVCMFDITRAQAEHSDHLYSFAEKLKGGYINSTKYESRVLYGKPPHVIFFSNSSWNRDKFSVDRVQEINLSLAQQGVAPGAAVNMDLVFA